MTRKLPPIILVALLVSNNLAWAESACNVQVKSETSGSALNPIVDKLAITNAKPLAAGEICELMVGDQIIEINQHVVPGASALKVREYFKEIKDGELVTFKVKRDDQILLVRTK